MRTILFPFLILLSLSMACSGNSGNTEQKSLSGRWRGVIHMQKQELPFTFALQERNDSLLMQIFNADEVLEVNELYWQGDTLVMPMHIFDTEIRAVVESGSMKGSWIKNYADNYALPFEASREEYRFLPAKASPAVNLNGKWAVTLMGKDGEAPESYNAVGVFEQEGNKLSGTFLTPTGDYRYLEGNIDGTNIHLSAFDGEHAFLFDGEILNNNQLSGTFRSGKSWSEAWTAQRDSSASLPDANSLTFLKEGYDKLTFSFPDLEKNMVSLEDPKYQGKVVIVQLFGTWCPNCMDETRFLSDWYRKNKDQNVAIIGLAYEKKDDYDYARQRVQRMIDRFGVEYDFLIAGTADKKAAARTLPMLNHVMSFPTTIFIDKEGRVRKIHTGFSGPGTGEYYTRFVEEFNLFTDKLLSE